MSCIVNAVPASQYILGPPLQDIFIDKDSGELLAYGVVTFYSDDDHTQLKPVFTISGPPDSPVFTELPNPLTLSGIGTFIDPNNNQDILIYYLPYDADGNIQQYYITVYNSNNVLQFTRDHFPQINTIPTPTVVQVANFIPNGQFLLHQDIPNSGLVNSDTPYYPIAYGGWVFQINANSTSTNFVTFHRYDSAIDNPQANPRYACRVQCTVTDPADSEKDLSLYITDVNFLQGQIGTYQFTGYSNDGVNHNVELVLRKYFGAGGSPTTETVLDTFVITPQIQNFITTFTVESNIGLTLGAGNDDNVSFILRAPLETVSDIFYTDVILVAGTYDTLTYPNVSPEQAKVFALPASFDTPAYDGSDEGSFVQLNFTDQNQQRLAFTYTDLSTTLVHTGMHFAYVGLTAPDGYVMEDGSSYAVQEGGDVTPYIDLFNVILPGSTPGTYEYGTGINGFTNQTRSNVNELRVVWNRFDIAQPAPNAGTSGFTFSLVQSVNPNIDQQIYLQTVVAASSIAPGAYYTLPVNTTGPQFVQLFWFTIDGNGTQPGVPFDVVVKIDLLSSDTDEQVRDKIIQFANGLFQVPDLQYRYIRYWNNGSYHGSTLSGLRDPSQNNRADPLSPQFISYITGNEADNIGSLFSGFLYHGVAVDNTLEDLFFNAIIKT